MKERIIIIIAAIAMFSLNVKGDDFNQLWREYDKMEHADMPRSMIGVLEKIVQKATKQHAYGHLAKAQFLRMSAMTKITPDSLNSELTNLENKVEAAEKTDRVLAAVYHAVLGKCYESLYTTENHDSLSEKHYARAMEETNLLAKTKQKDYLPAVIEGKDSEWFDCDMLHVVGYTVGDFAGMHNYYRTTTNRMASMITAIDMLKHQNNTTTDRLADSQYMEKLDSLMGEYGDMDAACEIAICRYRLMEGSDKISEKEKYDYLVASIERWKNWRNCNELRQFLDNLTRSSFAIDLGNQQILPNEERKVKLINIKNVGEVRVVLTRLNTDGNIDLNVWNDKDLQKLKRLQQKDTRIEIVRKLEKHADYEVFEDSLSIPRLQLGLYLVEVITDVDNIKPQYELVNVSNVFVVCEQIRNNQMRIAVVDATEGMPISHARLLIETTDNWRSNAIKQEVETNERGEFLFGCDQHRSYSLWAYTPTDKYMLKGSCYNHYNSYRNKNTVSRVYLLTDREIYRPGQEVNVALVAYEVKATNEVYVLANKKYDLSLYDANYQKLETAIVETDDMGKASTKFKIPEGGLTGVFRISGRNVNEVSFSVEEYKRPTFEVGFDDFTDSYKAGDTVWVAGWAKSYAGVPVQGGKVKYKVRRENAWWWHWWNRDGNENELLAEGEATIDDEGKFLIPMPIMLPESEIDNSLSAKRHPQFYNIVTEADIADMGGETHTATMKLPIGTRQTAFSIDMEEKILKEETHKVKFNYTNMAGKAIDAIVYVSVDGQQIGRFKANEAIELSRLNTLSSGRHTLNAICQNDTLEREFIVFSRKDTKAVVETNDWFYISSTEFANSGEPIYLQLGTSREKTHIIYNLFTIDRVLEKGEIELNNELHNRRFEYKSDYNDAVAVSYAWVKDGQLYRHTATLYKQLPDKALKTQWKTFRNRLKPGQEETWTLQVLNPDGKPADAQIVTAMYDKSLDQIRKHSWDIDVYLNRPSLNSQWQTTSKRQISMWMMRNSKSFDVESFSYSTFDHRMFDVESPRYFGLKRGDLRMMKNASAPMAVAVNDVVMDYAVAKESADVEEMGASTPDAGTGLQHVLANEEDNSGSKDGTGDLRNIELRENLAETAFFYPALQTDKDGNVEISFKLPESLTSWRFMAFVHDKKMNHALTEAETVAKKDLMLQPNMPRFMRVGDKVVITSKVINTSETAQEGDVIMQLVDPETEEVVYQQKKTFDVKEDETTKVSFSYQSNDDSHSLLICKIVAVGNNFSDGEQHYLPVLSNKEQVTNTRSFTQNNAGRLDLDLNELFDRNASNQHLTIEYANNPAWMMIQAMPTYSDASGEDAISQMTSLYVNTIAAAIMNQSPLIKQTIEQWRENNGVMLESELDKNQELKTLLTKETPWVVEMKDEASQRRSLMKFFDEETLRLRKNKATLTLKKLQNGDGSWSWCPGMEGSVYITTAVSEMIVRMNKLVGGQQETDEMQAKAFGFLDNYILKEYDYLMKLKQQKNKDYLPSETILHILYINSLQNRHPKGKAETAYNYFVNQLSQKTSLLSIYGKACSALILSNSGYEKRAEEYLKSMEEYSVATEEMGRYYDTSHANYSWFDYKIPTQVAAIEVINKLKPNEKQIIMEMKRWLLQEKRTTSWSTPINAVNAIYAFLNGNIAVLESREPTIITLDGMDVEMKAPTAGVGYQKVCIERGSQEVLTFDKSTDNTSWGAVYAQFTQNNSDIKPMADGLSIKREIIPERSDMKIGDKVKIRITINAERDFDFVQVVDKRAACLQPISQLSGYRYGYYAAPHDFETKYYFNKMSKGTHVVETEYFIEHEGEYETGVVTAQCAYSPVYKGRNKAEKLIIK